MVCITCYLNVLTGKYHQFDNMVFPHSKIKPVFTRVFEGFKRLVGSSDKKPALQVPNHETMQKKCLDVYLAEHRRVLCGCTLSSDTLNIACATNGIIHIFTQLYSQKITRGRPHDWIAESLALVKMEKLYNVFITSI